jgi:hypothetical protein
MGNLFEDVEPLPHATVARDTVFKAGDVVECVDDIGYGGIRYAQRYIVTLCRGSSLQLQGGGRLIASGFMYPAKCFKLVGPDGNVVNSWDIF